MSDQAQRLRELVESRQNPETVIPLRPSARKIRTIAVTSGKGGVGKTNIVANLSIALSRRGLRVLLVDADLSLANVDVLLGLQPRFNLSHFLLGERSLREIVLPGPHGVRVVPASSGVSELAMLKEKELEGLIQEFSEFSEEVDLILIDTAAGLSDSVMAFVLAADEVILVTTPEPTAYIDAYQMLKTIHRDDPDKRIFLVVNMASTDREARETSEFMSKMAKEFLRHEITILGSILRDPDVPTSIRGQKPFLEESPHGIAARGIQGLATHLLNSGRKDFDLDATKGTSLWSRVVQYMKKPRSKSV